MEEKFCKNCKHFIPKNTINNWKPMCQKSGVKDLVFGEFKYIACDAFRGLLGDCGTHGNLFEPKEQKE